MLERTEKNFNILKKRINDEKHEINKNVNSLHESMEQILLEKVDYLEKLHEKE